MESFNFDKSTLKYYNDDDKRKMIDQFQKIEKQLEEYFKKSNLCIIKLHKFDNLNDLIKYSDKFNNNKKIILINLLPLMEEKIAEIIIKSKKYESFHTNIYIAYNGKYISSKEKKINESFLNLCNDILKTEEYECNICMETIINNLLLVQCLKCKYTVCSKCKYKMKLKCPICDR